mgnify:CR=1 FL=1
MNALEIMGVYESEIIAEFHPSLTRSLVMRERYSQCLGS